MNRILAPADGAAFAPAPRRPHASRAKSPLGPLPWRAGGLGPRRRRNVARTVHLISVGLGVLSLGGCATYRPLPLPAQPDLAQAPALTVPVSQLDLPGLAPHAIDPGRPLDETSVITLAVLNNPELKARRLQAGVARAQMFAAGLLPDPRLSAGLSRSTAHGGYSLGLSEEIRSLVTRSSARAAARAHEREVNLQILWQEWQVAARAEELYVQACAERRLLAALKESRDLWRNRQHAEAKGLRRNEVTAGALTADLAALSTADTRLRQEELAANRTRHALDGLLGLDPAVTLRLAAPDHRPSLSAAEFHAAVAALPRRRADLLALQAGYESRQQRLREAILAQFPSLSAGAEKARSAEEGVPTIGFTVNLSLPIFDRNRGSIAVGRATRAQLRQAYQSRLDSSVVQADRMWKAVQIMATHQRERATQLAGMRRAAASAKQELRRGDLDIEAFLKMDSDYISAQAEAIRLDASLDQARAALQVLLALPFGGRTAP